MNKFRVGVFVQLLGRAYTENSVIYLTFRFNWMPRFYLATYLQEKQACALCLWEFTFLAGSH